MKKHTLPVRFTGQHFTIDAALIKDAIRLADIQKDDLVLDIGAGSGFLTIHLARCSDNVVAIENDKRLASTLQATFRRNRNVVIAAVDFRRFNLPKKAFKVVANIPFRITSIVLKSLMYVNFEYFDQGCLIMQLESAQKLIRQKLSNPQVVFYRTFFRLELISVIGPESFMPPPRVKSALLSICKRRDFYSTIGVERKAEYLCFLTFMLRRPELPLRTVLKKIFRKKQLAELAKQYALKLDHSVSALSPKQFLRCFVHMLELVPPRYHPQSK